MQGKTHKMFAPIFTLGATLLLSRSGRLSHPGDPMMVATIATASSLLTAVSADADLHSYKPTYVIWDIKPGLKKGGAYHLTLRGGRKVKYTSPRNIGTKIWATIFKSIGVTKHRDWRSHSPSVWIPLSYIAYKISVSFTSNMSNQMLKSVIPSIVLGMVLGYLSHIVADAPNKGGIPLFFGNKQFSITKKMFGNNLSNFFRSGNKIFNYLFIATGIDIVMLIIAPDLTKAFNKMIFGGSISIIKGILDIVVQLFTSIFKLLRK